MNEYDRLSQQQLSFLLLIMLQHTCMRTVFLIFSTLRDSTDIDTESNGNHFSEFAQL